MAATQLLDRFRVDLTQVKNSTRWYNDQVQAMKKGQVTSNRMLRETGMKHVNRIQPGQLYFYYYDPKLKDTLPYYDTFPLVFPFKAVPGGFLGLNLHYLGYPERFALFKKLLSINGGKIHDDLKMKYTWQTVSQFASIKGVDACIKHYLYDHVRSPFMKVQPVDWTTAMLLPVEKFVGAKKEFIWSESKKR